MNAPIASYAYYPGCSQEGSSLEFGQSVKAISGPLGIELVEIDDWTCCGSTPAHNIDSKLSAALSARNLVQAQKMGQKQVTSPCPSCVGNLRAAELKMGNPEFAEKANNLLDEPYGGGTVTKTFLQVVYEDVGPEAVAKAVTNPLKGLSVVCYYGCLTTRPNKLMAFDSEENPQSMDKIMAACGAKVLDFPFKTECCGASMAVPKGEVLPPLSGRILELANLSGADAIVVACPLCQVNLDLRRNQIQAATGQVITLPVIYFSQLVGLALGLSESELGISKLVVSPEAALAKIGQEAPTTRKESSPCA